MRLTIDPVWTAEFADAMREATAKAVYSPYGREAVFIEPTGGEGSGLLIVGTTTGGIRSNERIVHGSMRP